VTRGTIEESSPPMRNLKMKKNFGPKFWNFFQKIDKFLDIFFEIECFGVVLKRSMENRTAKMSTKMWVLKNREVF